MASQPCQICQNHRGKRFCPARNIPICAICCARLRGTEIQCRDDCPHLRQSREYFLKRIEPLRDQELARRGQRLAELGEATLRLVFDFESIIQELKRSFSNLTDQEVREGIEMVRSTCETLEKGVIYNFSSPSPRVQALIRNLQGLIDERQNALDQGGNRIFPLSNIIKALNEVTDSISRLSHQGKGSNPYLEFLESTAALK